MGYDEWEDNMSMTSSYKDNLTMKTNHSLSNFYSHLFKNATHLTNITAK